MKISARTMAAAKKAAAEQKVSVDKWANQVLARAARGEQPDIEALLHDIVRKIDRIAERQSFGEKTNEQLATAVDEIGASFKQMRTSTGRVLDQVRSRTGSAVSEMAEKAKDVIGQVSRSATELAGNIAPKTDAEKQPAKEAKPRRPRTTGKPGARGGARSKPTARRRTTTNKRKT